MRGRIVKVNYRRGLVVFEDSSGDYGLLELLGRDDLEEDDVIVGNLHNLGGEVVVKVSTGEKYDVSIEDWGMSLTHALNMITN